MNCIGVNQDMMSNYNKSSSMLPLQLVGPPTMLENHLISDENSTNLTLEEAIDRINQLTAENAQLKTTIQQTNASMKMAVESFAALQARTKQDKEESLLHYNESRTVVQKLKKQISDKDHVIATLKKQISEDPVELQPSDDVKQLENENKKLSMEAEELKLKSSQREQLLTNEIRELKVQFSSLLRNQETEKQNLLQQKTEIENKYLNLEGLLKKLQSEEQKKLEIAKMQNEKVNAELVTVSRKYEQLMSDYHDLLTSNDQQKNTQSSQAVQMKIDYEGRVDNLTAQLVTAEEVLDRKQEHIKTLMQKLNDLEPLQAQVAIYKADFEAERKSREDLNDRLLELQEKYQRLELSVNPNLSQPNVSRDPVHPPMAMPLRFGLNMPRPAIVDRHPGPIVSPVNVTRPSLTAVPDPEPEPDLKCPICSRICPDIDSLQLHVNECLESH